VFWVADQTYLVAAIAAGVATFVLVRLARLPANLFLVPDALGLALFTVIGTQIALTLGAPWFVATFLGVVTGVFGGVLRDILCNEVPLVFAGELYATASWPARWCSSGCCMRVWTVRRRACLPWRRFFSPDCRHLLAPDAAQLCRESMTQRTLRGALRRFNRSPRGSGLPL